MTNAYCEALEALRSQPCHELKEVGDQWCTPDGIFWGINAMFGPLVLDLFADASNAKCPAWYTAEDNAIQQDWSEKLSTLGGGAAFANPPYSRATQHEGDYITGMRYIMQHAMAMREKGGRYVFLIKAATSEVWWPEEADHIAFIRGRLGFDLPSWFIPKDEKQKPTGAFFAGAVAVFDKTWKGPAVSYINRADLEASGNAFMSQVRFEAERMLARMAKEPEHLPVVEEPAEQEKPAPARVKEAEKPEMPLTREDILSQSGITVLACAVAAFGDKEAYTFTESRYAHIWAADSVENPVMVTIPQETISKALAFVQQDQANNTLREFVASQGFDNDDLRQSVTERLITVSKECAEEYGLSVGQFIAIAGGIDHAAWQNYRHLRAAVRTAMEQAA